MTVGAVLAKTSASSSNGRLATSASTKLLARHLASRCCSLLGENLSKQQQPKPHDNPFGESLGECFRELLSELSWRKPRRAAATEGSQRALRRDFWRGSLTVAVAAFLAKTSTNSTNQRLTTSASTQFLARLLVSHCRSCLGENLGEQQQRRARGEPFGEIFGEALCELLLQPSLPKPRPTAPTEDSRRALRRNAWRGSW